MAERLRSSRRSAAFNGRVVSWIMGVDPEFKAQLRILKDVNSSNLSDYSAVIIHDLPVDDEAPRLGNLQSGDLCARRVVSKRRQRRVGLDHLLERDEPEVCGVGVKIRRLATVAKCPTAVRNIIGALANSVPDGKPVRPDAPRRNDREQPKRVETLLV
jgi:hypothetical protein